MLLGTYVLDGVGKRYDIVIGETSWRASILTSWRIVTGVGAIDDCLLRHLAVWIRSNHLVFLSWAISFLSTSNMRCFLFSFFLNLGTGWSFRAFSISLTWLCPEQMEFQAGRTTDFVFMHPRLTPTDSSFTHSNLCVNVAYGFDIAILVFHEISPHPFGGCLILPTGRRGRVWLVWDLLWRELRLSKCITSPDSYEDFSWISAFLRIWPLLDVQWSLISVDLGKPNSVQSTCSSLLTLHHSCTCVDVFSKRVTSIFSRSARNAWNPAN